MIGRRYGNKHILQLTLWNCIATQRFEILFTVSVWNTRNLCDIKYWMTLYEYVRKILRILLHYRVYFLEYHTLKKLIPL
jgi:hypothetical protein